MSEIQLTHYATTANGYDPEKCQRCGIPCAEWGRVACWTLPIMPLSWRQLGAALVYRFQAYLRKLGRA